MGYPLKINKRYENSDKGKLYDFIKFVQFPKKTKKICKKNTSENPLISFERKSIEAKVFKIKELWGLLPNLINLIGSEENLKRQL